MKKITYSQVGDNYETKDPIKLLAQEAAEETAINLEEAGFSEVTSSRGESAYVWKQGNVYMASAIEGLGTKNLIADKMYKLTGNPYYEIIAHDTVATIVNDLVTVGAKPLVVNAYWAIEDNSWLEDTKRMQSLIQGWQKACNIAGASWGGGETATMKQVLLPNTVELGGSAVGIITSERRLLNDEKLRVGDTIILLQSNGVNANGISLTRAIADKLSEGYGTKLPSGQTYGEALLTKTNIYAKLIQTLLDFGIELHYISNITGHGLRKIMRARQNYTYRIHAIIPPQEVFPFIQKHAGLSTRDMYDTYNMGMDYALFLPEKDVEKALDIIHSHRFHAINAGVVERGKKQVIIEPENITFSEETLHMRI
ncbi:MAG TPA: AIR synthase related protein [Candidatus Saccharimonadales bacterium]|nr:AIR synthase related protein [Candidatus Saccharimonadales bacterium]